MIQEQRILFSREWAMPSRWTFEIKPIKKLIEKWIVGKDSILDPFSGKSKYATHSNDLASGGVHAVEFLDKLIDQNESFDLCLLDPPYSPRQISECYKKLGLKVSQTDTMNALLYKDCKDRMAKMTKPEGVSMTFGWNSSGFGLKRGFEIVEILIVCHGAAHNDTVCVVERKAN